MTTKKSVTIKESLDTGLRTDRIEYTIFVNNPATGAPVHVTIKGTFDQNIDAEAKAIFKLLVENGWASNPVMSKYTYYDQHLSIHAEPDAKKPPPPQV
jgi:hypothetical protein